MVKAAKKLKVVSEPLRLDIGCGINKRPGFIGIDQYKLPGVDVVMDVRKAWTYADNSVEEIHCSQFLEHLTALERVNFFNEAYRVLIPDGKLTVITPHWASNRAYGDFTHQWPPVAEMLYYYVNREWRLSQAPHNDISVNPQGYNCHFAATWGYGMSPAVVTRNIEFQQFALANYKEAASDLHATLIKK